MKVTTKAERAFDALLRHVFAVEDEKLRRKLSKAMLTDALSGTWSFHLNLPYNDDLTDLPRLKKAFSPSSVCYFLDRCVDREILGRVDANQIQERVLKNTNRDGAWER